MKLASPLLLVLLTTATAAQAQPVDVFGGQEGAQTIAHCGYLKTQNVIYTDSPVTTRIVQKKLRGLGFYMGELDGVHGTRSKGAVRAFQTEYGLSADGVVGPITAQRLAYVTNPRANVQRCWREADANFR